MSHPARLSLRAPPHLPFIQGFPGIPGGKDRKQAALCGTVEVRVGAQPIKAKWVRVECRKHESLPAGFPAQAQTDSWELVGEIITLWQAQGKEFDTLQTADFKFFLPLPETLPPTVEMAKGTGVWYELVAALSYRKKGGIFKSDSATIMKITEPIRVTKHELHAVWPVYNHPDQKSVAGQDLTMTIQRPGVAFGPGDRILLTASLKSARALPFKLRGFECTLLEVVSYIPESLIPSKDGKRKPKGSSQPVVKSRPISQARCAVDESVFSGGERSARIDMAVPADVLVTVRNAKTLEVGYELQVKAVCDGFEGPVVPGIKYVVGQYSRSSAQQAMSDIGHIDQLCGGPPRSARPQSSIFTVNTPPLSANGSPAPQGFVAPDPRRVSTSTITTVTTAERAGDFSPTPSTRPYSTVPNRQTLTFPIAQPTPMPLPGSPAPGSISEFSHSQMDATSDTGHTNRYSTMTTGTFGKWDQTLRSNMQAALTPPITPDLSSASKPTWDSAEREKMDLYTRARQSAASTQHSGGAALDQLGLADIPDIDVAPPEYAPPVPALPGGKYQPPVRPVSAYTSPDPSTSSAVPSPELDGPSSPILFTAGPNGSGGIARTENAGSPNAADVRSTLPAAVGAAGAAGTSESPARADLASGLSEKEQMRRYYEAKDRVENRGEGSSAYVPAGPSPAPTPVLSEREQMRRYYEAKDKVDNRGEGSSAAASTSAPAFAGSSPAPVPTPVLSEKEQMRRYYEARERVEQSQQGTASGSGIAPSGSAPPAGPVASGSGSGFAPNGSHAYPSATDEKDAMRRRYEDATTRVSRGGTASPAIMDSPTTYFPPSTSTQPPPFSPSTTTGSSDRAPIPTSSYPSATDEKERMRRLYEDANQRASRARASLSPPPEAPPRFSAPPAVPPSPIPGPNGVSSSIMPIAPPTPSSNPLGFSSSLDAGPSSSAAPSTTPAYPSAEQEKESMRRRYDDASSAVSRARVASGGGGSEGMARGKMGSGESAREGSGGAGEEDTGAPPPPLPSRPPAEYINLLSPVGESAPWGRDR